MGGSFRQSLKLLSNVPDITPMRSLRLIPRWNVRSTLSMPSSSLRAEVRPPSLRHAPASPWQRLVFWLMAPAPLDTAPPLSLLPRVRGDFISALADVGSAEGLALADRISLSRSLRELWHLRADVYRVVSLQHSQFEADQRLAGLNRHFPTRAPRSGFAPL
jgi:hypothetical protein